MGEPRVAAPSPCAEELFTELLLRAQWALYDFVRGLVGETEVARDVVQDVFVDAWKVAKQGAPPFTADGDELGRRRWLFRVAYRHAAAVWRRRRVIAWETLDLEHLPNPVPFEDRIAEAELLRAALLSIEPQDAACFLLNVVHGFTANEMAEILTIAPEAAKKRLSRAKQRLRAAYFAHERKTLEPQESGG
jgi:RNA polymerase sigma-70 factor (ECF subfamily)